MRAKSMSSFFLAILLLFLVAASAQAGWVIHEKQGPNQSVLYIQDNHMRTDAAGKIILMDLDKQELFFVDPARKAYWGGKVAEFKKFMEKTMGQMKQMLSQMKEAMKQMPPEQRKAMMEMMKQNMPSKQPPPRVSVRKTGQTGKVAGYKVRKYEVVVNGKLREEQWVASGVDVADELDPDKLAEFVEAMSVASPEDAYHSSPEVMALFKKGYPLKRKTLTPNGAHVTVATKVAEKSLSSNLFQLPKGYRKVNLKDMLRHGG